LKKEAARGEPPFLAVRFSIFDFQFSSRTARDDAFSYNPPALFSKPQQQKGVFMRRALLAVVSLVIALTTAAESLGPAFREAPLNAPDPTPPPGRPAKVVVTLPEQLALSAVDREVPNRVGQVRRLREPLEMQGRASSAAFRSPGAHRVRLLLTHVDLPANTRVWVRSDTEWRTVDLRRTAPDRTLWTPSVAGDTAILEVEGVDERPRLRVGAVVAIWPPAANDYSCFLDATCYDSSEFDFIEEARNSTAVLFYVTSDGYYSYCTGGLINDKANRESYLLTANHCISTAAEAASVEAGWDVFTSSCAGAADSPVLHPGAQLMTTSPATDMTLLKMTTLPAGRWHMGWNSNTNVVKAGTILHRISHPASATSYYAQIYSSTRVSTTTSVCRDLPRPNFLYSTNLISSAGPGSSGSPVMIAGGYIVGQMFGKCGSDYSDPCNTTNSTVDGALSASWPLLAPFLDNGGSVTPPPCTPCVANATTACMLGGRFKTTMTWTDPYANTQGTGRTINIAGVGDDQTFWSMYPSAPDSIEMVVRMVDGRGANGKFWTSVAGFAVAGYTITIQDTQTCNSWTRTVAPGSSEIIKDPNAL
jgi:hypothetical protein